MWQPIETAPKDREILIWSKFDGHAWIAMWRLDFRKDGGWYAPYAPEGDCFPFDITHWAELPPSPPH